MKGKKIAAVGLFGNVALISTIFYRRQTYLEEEDKEKRNFQAVQSDSDLDCYFTAKQYYDQCRFDEDRENCTDLAEAMEACKKKVFSLINAPTPAMQLESV
jgi:hypothetical protein